MSNILVPADILRARMRNLPPRRSDATAQALREKEQAWAAKQKQTEMNQQEAELIMDNMIGCIDGLWEQGVGNLEYRWELVNKKLNVIDIQNIVCVMLNARGYGFMRRSAPDTTVLKINIGW